MNNSLLVDTGFWIALFDPQQKRFSSANRLVEYVDQAELIVPWPIVYEILRTRFVRRPDWVSRLDGRLKKPDVNFIDDASYRDEAYSLTVEYSTVRKRDISMVDMVCRLIIADQNVRTDYLLTTNPKDFHDVCFEKGVTILE